MDIKTVMLLCLALSCLTAPLSARSKWIWSGNAGTTRWQTAKNWVDDEGSQCPEGFNYPQSTNGTGAADLWLPIEIHGTKEKPLTVIAEDGHGGIEGYHFTLSAQYATVKLESNLNKLQTPSSITLRDEAKFYINDNNNAMGQWTLDSADVGDGCLFALGTAMNTVDGSPSFNLNLNKTGRMELVSWCPSTFSTLA